MCDGQVYSREELADHQKVRGLLLTGLAHCLIIYCPSICPITPTNMLDLRNIHSVPTGSAPMPTNSHNRSTANITTAAATSSTSYLRWDAGKRTIAATAAVVAVAAVLVRAAVGIAGASVVAVAAVAVAGAAGKTASYLVGYFAQLQLLPSTALLVFCSFLHHSSY